MHHKKTEQRDAFFDPRCCSYRLGREIREHVDELVNLDDIDPGIKSILINIMDEDETNKNTLPYDSLVKLHKYISRADEYYTQPFYLFAEACKCIEPKPRDNKQLDSRLKLLRLRNSQTMYTKMTASVDRVFEEKLEKLTDTVADNISSKVYSNLNNATDSHSRVSEFKNLNGSVVAVINSFLVFICTFVFFYKALEYALPKPNIIAQVLFGIGGSTIVAIAELYFLLRVI